MNNELIKKYRGINVDHEWWEFVCEDFVRKMEEVGIEVGMRGRAGRMKTYHEPAIYFSGFYSQGDGACFDGHVADWEKFFEAHKEYFAGESMSYATTQSPPLFASWTSHGMYSHEGTLRFDVTVEEPEAYAYDEDGAAVLDLPTACANALYDVFNYPEFEESVSEIVKGYCVELYETLEAEHDYLTSDEAVWETIVANELDKEEV